MERERKACLRAGPRGAYLARPQTRPETPFAAVLLAAALGAAVAQGAPAPDREAWRKVETGRITVVGTASDSRLAETAVTLRALVALLPGLLPGAFGPPPPLVAAVVHDARHLAAAGYPPAAPAGGRIVLATTSDEEARGAFLRSATAALAGRSTVPFPAWLATGLADYLSTFSATEAKATLGRLVPEHVASLKRARFPAAGPILFREMSISGEGATGALLRAEAWAVVHLLLQGTPEGEEKLGRFVAFLSEGREASVAFLDAFGESERALLTRARAHVVESRPLARVLPVPASAPPVSRLLPITRAGAAGVLGGVARGRHAPEPEAPAPADQGGRSQSPIPVLSSAAPRPPAAVSRDVPAEVDLVNRLIDEGREEEALVRLEALHASLGRDPEMQRALGWDVQEVRRVVVHNRLIRRYNEGIGLLNADRTAEALANFREVAAAAEDPGLRRLAWERATAPDGGRH